MTDWKTVSQQAHELREKNQEFYDSSNVEPTEHNGRVYRSRLEALWVAEFDDCDSLECVECVQVPVWIDGPYGRFLSNYKPDLVIQTGTERCFVELKPNKELAKADDRQHRAGLLNPKYRFVVIGGYPYESRGVYVRLVSGGKEMTVEKMPVDEVLKFLGCI